MTTMQKPTARQYSLLPVWGFIPAVRDIAFKRLAGAIIGQAAADARKDDTTGIEARGWLLSADCAEMCEFIGLDHNAVRVWVNNGCPNWRIVGEGAPEPTKVNPFRR